MLYLNVYLIQNCKKHLYCNLFWIPTQFDRTIIYTNTQAESQTDSSFPVDGYLKQYKLNCEIVGLPVLLALASQND